MDVLSRWKQVSWDRRVFVGVVLGFPLLMSGLFSAAGGQGYFGTGLQVGGFASAMILAGAALGWVWNFGAQVIFGVGREDHELNYGHYLSRLIVRNIAGAIQKTAAWVETAIRTVAIILVSIIAFWMIDFSGVLESYLAAMCIICILFPGEREK